MTALIFAGCRSGKSGAQSMVKSPGSAPGATNLVATRPVAPPQIAKPEPKAPARDVTKEQKEKIKAVEKSLSERRAAQGKLDRQMEDLRKQLFETAQTIRDVKVRADVLTGIQQTNAAAIASIEESLRKLQSPSSQEVKSLQDALAKEKQSDEKNAAALAQSRKELADLKSELEAPAATPAPAAEPTPAPTGVVSATKLVADGKQLLRQNKLVEAEQAFHAALAQAPGLVGARVGLAACRYNAGDLAQAKRLVADALAADKNNAQALGLKGIIAWREGRNREAVSILADAVKADPGDAQLHSYMGVALHARERFADATEELRKAVGLDAQNAEAQYNLSVMLATARAPQLNEARLHYEQALQLGYPRDDAMDGLLYGAMAP
ncbi:MAG: tetratricopeptide repeat protein [bacterium]